MPTHEVIVPLNARHAPRDTLARPMRDLRISVMDRCNFRCPYCMPRETFHDDYRFLGSQERLSFEEIVRLARLFVQLGVRKLRLTGGEPLLRANLPELIGDLSAIPGVEDVALTTNGVLLARYAAELRAAGLKRITVSLDSLDPEVFARMSGGLGGVDDVLDGIEHAPPRRARPASRSTPWCSAASTTTRRSIWSSASAAPVSSCASSSTWTSAIATTGSRSSWCRRRSLRRASARAGRCEPLQRDYRGEVAQRYAFADGQGEVGFISSVSQPFCGDCSRARLSSDGCSTRACSRTHGTSLRDALRGGASDEQLAGD